ncbi:IS1595 family transposase [Crocinitomicaceae bacterium CZZ-1]|uniref:IS1595 family transposase n=1 Tax=Taishania pollutisoli TaxID=2766479 RepID=A0A8J6TYC7_9FLAO|nr:IS1595 family transposase [Taishania pollutisoli]MBC9813916.1 IS1595 family transposase [Taishania pollutisoli]
MTILEFQDKFSTEQSIINYYIQIKYNGNLCCDHCGSDKVYHRKDKLKMYQCETCNNNFSIFKGTIFEKSSTSLRKWFYAIHLFLNSKKGISGCQLQREVGVTYKTAWRMLKQIRTAMASKGMKDVFSSTVEIDETYIGGKPRKKNKGMQTDEFKNKRGRGSFKTPVIGIIDRTSKQVYAKVALPNENNQKLTGKQLLSILSEVTKTGTTVISDEFRSYNILSKSGFIHLKVDHSKEFAKDEIHTNNIESFWGILKRGIYGIYHSVSVKYMQNYINEFSFRYNNRFNENIFDTLIKNTHQ